jgi:hypothetical protein
MWVCNPPPPLNYVLEWPGLILRAAYFGQYRDRGTGLTSKPVCRLMAPFDLEVPPFGGTDSGTLQNLGPSFIDENHPQVSCRRIWRDRHRIRTDCRWHCPRNYRRCERARHQAQYQVHFGQQFAEVRPPQLAASSLGNSSTLVPA